MTKGVLFVLLSDWDLRLQWRKDLGYEKSPLDAAQGMFLQQAYLKSNLLILLDGCRIRSLPLGIIISRDDVGAVARVGFETSIKGPCSAWAIVQLKPNPTPLHNPCSPSTIENSSIQFHSKPHLQIHETSPKPYLVFLSDLRFWSTVSFLCNGSSVDYRPSLSLFLSL